ncbi:unnamed protein product [Psylliodes chrysocephalus]|uniref:Uncharacterized protein n=1 Tax=Psylliodes chrysocephalus TaxID=3402493 RepID=A0A9P0GA28_9CUCU|nr:unnamed protein product [Psylliodes chrysocephala]
MIVIEISSPEVYSVADSDCIPDSEDCSKIDISNNKVQILHNIIIRPGTSSADEIGKPQKSQLFKVEVANLNTQPGPSSFEPGPSCNTDSELTLNIQTEKENIDPDYNEGYELVCTKNRTIRDNTRENTYKRKKDMCYFCETDVLNFARHIKRNHFCELEVQQIFSNGKKTKERRELLAVLKKKGNFLKNSTECVKPVKQALQLDKTFLPCPECLGFYRSKFLYRHRKKCCKEKSSKTAQADSQTFTLKNLRIDQYLKDVVFPKMRADKISLEAKNDFLICAFGARYLKLHREKHFINVTSRKMRELSRILLELKKIEPSINNLFQGLQPKYYDKFVEVTKLVAKYDKDKDLYMSPTFAINICTSLKQCCDIAIHMIVKQESSVEQANVEANLKTMINLLQSNWRFDISSQAANDLNINRYNKITIVPLASDLKLLKEYLISEAENALKELKENSLNISAFNILLETIYCRVILLNRRRPGELQRMLLHTYENSEKKSESYEEFSEVVSETEKILLKKLKRVVIRGKRGRGVPVMFSSDTQNHITELLNVRPNFLGKENPYLFGKPGLTTPIHGYKIIAKYAKACGAKNPDAITCTKLRKHLATLTQLFNLTENEIEQLSTFMGHTSAVHRNSYRLPDDLYQTAKISKLLLLMEKGQAGEYKGKSLDDIPIDMDENLLLCHDNERDNDGDSENEEQDVIPENETEEQNLVHKKLDSPKKHKPVPKKHKQKRILVPWTTRQKKVVTTYFKNNIKNRKPPIRQECDELKSQYPELLSNKDWLKIKVFVQNLYTKKKN